MSAFSCRHSRERAPPPTARSSSIAMPESRSRSRLIRSSNVSPSRIAFARVARSVANRQAEDRRLGGGVEGGRAAAGEVGQDHQIGRTLRTARQDQVIGVPPQPAGLLEFRLAADVAEPAKQQAAAVVERHGHIQARHDVAVDRDPPFPQGIGQHRGLHGHFHHLGGPGGDHGQAVADHAAAQGRTGLVVTAACQKDFALQSEFVGQVLAERAEDLDADGRQGRKTGRIDAARLQNVRRPAAGGQVVHLRPRGQTMADRRPAAEPAEEEILVQEELAGRLQSRGS